MANQSIRLSEGWSQFYGPNLGYMLEKYEDFQDDPALVEEELQSFFRKWGGYKEETEPAAPVQSKDLKETSTHTYFTAIRAMKLSESIRRNGHLMADIIPVNLKEKSNIFNYEDFGLTDEEIRQVPPELLSPHHYSSLNNGLEAVEHLKETYTKRLAFEFDQVQDIEERRWLFQKVESRDYLPELTDTKKVQMLERLNKVEGFEHFIHKTFKGQKRFSIEGLDTMVPMLDEVVRESVEDGTEKLMVGMAHRGRLNVLAHVLGKPYEMIFSEFHDAPNKDLVPSEGSVGINYGWTGDVKYHLGADREIKESKSNATITLANNPSHLEFVNPVVEGFARAAQEDRKSPGFPKQKKNKALPILIHGDAAFPGQGIVAETLNLSQLNGYSTGGTIHVIANNMIGFTTVSDDSRSTEYASDLAKGYEIPVIHVNADDPEACLAAIHLAYLYRKEFTKDIVIDLIGYRRYGHNEMDEPLATQPSLYKRIKDHPTVFEIYGKKLVDEKLIEENKFQELRSEFISKLENQFDKIKQNKREHIDETMKPPAYVRSTLAGIDTKVPLKTLRQINDDLLVFPEKFNVFPKLEKILKRRVDSLKDDGKIDWGLAETLAFGSIISDGVPIRLTGQDSERGTFSHRHLILHDYETDNIYSPLHTLPSAKASFAVHNSPLSEAACVGFEYGYNVESPETLTIWEAQYGDFSNGAQVIFDQFISSGRAKWGQKSGIVLLLPHGYEGQGPEHSSGRMERFLTLAAENNWHVANLTKASQYFHLLRRQAKLLKENEIRPLVLMSPKSLLRNENVSSSPEDFSEGKFEPVIVNKDLGKNPQKVERLVFCSGKVAVELDEKIREEKDKLDWLQAVKIEELYPFPSKDIKEQLEKYPNVKELVWLQEEPQNMGAWHYILPYLQDTGQECDVYFIGRKRRSSPAEGDPKVHKKEQKRIITEAVTRNLEGSPE
ncbi:2-oxoglutarate dehydrogenase E1 component [Salipaludibacillus aurantiacus]|uniref:2-oxoglutarate dehydrogenase E1 component n=1 Tax=Salipaludibacillus aurantiacus TaxID=1601833 RepID=A0A1H9NYL7_9BACI|nr:2-oxoglutarate dehydrogenase E1 component [Salipaludibacillus aurantiacus]SER40907.1 2-oxoglutarate dehydrogenase E1 component [Salipaludibacillus aurantiacus]